MYKAEIENRGNSKYHATTRDYSFVIDTEGHGANPIDTLLASLCGCIGHQMRDYMRLHQILCNGFTVKAEAELTKDKDRLSDITVYIDLKNARLDKQQRDDMLTYVQRCKIHGTLKSGCTINMILGGPVEIKGDAQDRCNC